MNSEIVEISVTAVLQRLLMLAARERGSMMCLLRRLGMEKL
jgi:hypothetical protein